MNDKLNKFLRWLFRIKAPSREFKFSPVRTGKTTELKKQLTAAGLDASKIERGKYIISKDTDFNHIATKAPEASKMKFEGVEAYLTPAKDVHSDPIAGFYADLTEECHKAIIKAMEESPQYRQYILGDWGDDDE